MKGLPALVVAVFLTPVMACCLLLFVVAGAAGALDEETCATPAAAAAGEGGLTGPVRMPVAGRHSVTSEYGSRVHPVTGVRKLHTGLDLATTPSGGQVVAAAAGTVQSARAEGDGGNVVVVDHGSGLRTRYLHLRAWTVTAGEPVAAGQQIGVEGTTGLSTGEHLHFEVHQGQETVNPRTWLTQAGVDVDAGRAPPAVLRGAPGGSALAAGPSPHATSSATSAPASSSGSSAQGGSAARPLVTPPESVAGYRGEQLVNAATIIATGQRLGLDTWTITVAVMTAMGESGLVNVEYGDTAGPDSRGLFQQRANGAWGSLEDRLDPATASRSFFTALTRVPGYHQLEPTLAAHKTQINADPYHYARFWPAAVHVVAALTADPQLVDALASRQGTVPACNPIPGDPGMPVGPGPDGVLSVAAGLVGNPYQWGGSTPAAFDCSGFTSYVYAQVGVKIPRTAATQQQHATPVTDPLPGDLVFFGSPAHHVGIYAGNGQMYDAPRTGKTSGLHDIWDTAATYGRVLPRA